MCFLVRITNISILILELENQNGKTEMWYVVEAQDDAKIVLVLKRV